MAVVTDNDGNVQGLETKYQNYLGDNAKDYIKICYDPIEDSGELTIGNKPFNYNTLEPKFLKANNNTIINKILGTEKNDNELHVHMKANKTDCALQIFKTNEVISFPQYILDAIT